MDTLKHKGMLCMMWPVAVLGHRLQENDVISLPLKKDQTTYPHVSCNSVQKQQLKTMLEHFEEVHCKRSVMLQREIILYILIKKKLISAYWILF